MDLLASVLLFRLAAAKGHSQPPAATDAAVWVVTDILPSGLLNAEQASKVVQAVSLSFGSGLPKELIRQSAQDVEQLWAELF